VDAAGNMVSRPNLALAASAAPGASIPTDHVIYDAAHRLIGASIATAVGGCPEECRR
jgi:hypothetical protein